MVLCRSRALGRAIPYTGHTMAKHREAEADTATNPSRRRFLKRGVATAALLAVGIDWGEAFDEVMELLRSPTVKAHPVSVPLSKPIYRTPRAERLTPATEVRTIFSSVADYEQALTHVRRAQDLSQLQTVSQQILFTQLGARVAFGKSYQPDKWKQYALGQVEQATGIPAARLPQVARTIDAQYGTPAMSVAQYATEQTFAYAAPVPLTLLDRLGLTENVYVAGLQLHTPYFDKTIDNGVTDSVHGGIIVDCYEGGKPRQSIGRQWLHQIGFMVDSFTSQTATPFNDPEFARLIPGLEHINQHQLDYPDKDDAAIFNIASVKASQFQHILSGELILPNDTGFGSPDQLQQEVLLRRLYGSCPELPDGYFEDVTHYRRTHNALPAWSGQLTS